MTKIAVIYYSSTGNVYELAKAAVEGAESGGAETRLRRVKELAPEAAIQANPAWSKHVEETHGEVEEASLDDLEWADGYLFGSPTRYGNVTAQLKQFFDQTGPLWQKGVLSGKPVSGFTSAMNAHGGMESTILAMCNTFYHWGSLIVPPGYTDPLLYAAGGNPYGASWASGMNGDHPDEATLEAARYQGRRVAEFAAKLSGTAQE